MRALGSLIFALFAATGGGVSAQDVGDAVKGHEFARGLCAVCHAVDSDQPRSPHPSAPTFKRIAAEPGMTATALSVILRNPHREMPDLILKPEDRRNVIAYILTLKPTN